ncbi:hypothetical protein LTR91_012057 [Friedmanniomyces endolithicus]|uniref:Enoyl reductase (ER) domain-containing protein n=1 Tax=Friedmanniomyces endolithicus TaxID=329885 RepID=A0AAN6QRZ7_9PEZI|nr:hypothetical protein LTR59_000880 [Friedmanniomyces endolithicus]KAK0980930.1 hypothetical protein LTR91_012057 [Friedmanniomyces endolithicus]
MKEVIVHKGPRVQIIDSEIPKPGPGQVVTKVVVSGCNPKDWYVDFPQYLPWLAWPRSHSLPPKASERRLLWRAPTDPLLTQRQETSNLHARRPPVNQGDDISGIVHAVGANVSEFRPGDRVAAFHEMMKPGGSYAEYALSWAYTTFRLPEKTTFEEGAALPLAAMTAAVALYARLRLPAPWLPRPTSSDPNTPTPRTPLVIYGASSAIGSYAIQFAQRSNLHPLICIAGHAGSSHVANLISPEKGDVVVDYRRGDDAVVAGIRAALREGEKLEYAFDAVSEKGSYGNICRVLDHETGAITLVLPGRKYEGIPAGGVGGGVVSGAAAGGC